MNADSGRKQPDRACSDFVRELVQRPGGSAAAAAPFTREIPKRIVQFWDDLNQLPQDVSECIETWRRTEEQGIVRQLFDSDQARDFIRRRLSPRHERAYDKCYHPAMQSDYFRLCYILVEGGCYIDTDEVYDGAQFRTSSVMAG